MIQTLGAADWLSNGTGLVIIIPIQYIRKPHGTKGHRDILTLNIWLLRLTSCLLTSSVRRSGPRNRKKTENWTGPDRLGPDRQLRLRAIKMVKPI